MARRPPRDEALRRFAEAQSQVRQLERQLKVARARDSLIDFIEFMMPDPADPEDTNRSLYRAHAHHRLLAAQMEKVERGDCLRSAVSMPPQHGKTEIVSKMFAAWYAGRNPRKNSITASYNETYVAKIGGRVRAIMQSPRYQEVFPGVALAKGSKSKTELETVQGGQLNFIGRGGSGTGLPADIFNIDDPLKGADEANSAATVESLHEWYDSVVYSRARNTTAVSVVHTRWIEDDLIGRFCDPDHPWRQTEDGKAEAALWDYLNLPAVITDEHLASLLGIALEVPTQPIVINQFGKAPMAALWPEEFSLSHLASARRLNPRTFTALYQGKPTPDDGEYFKADTLIEYERDELPKNLRYYGASDHAVSEKQENDPTVIGCVGVDEDDNIWVLPDLVWERMQTDRTVEELLMQMRTHKPDLWWMEDELISRSFGPFLHKRMDEERIYCTIDPKRPSKDKRTRARAIQGRLSMNKVRFPRFAPWWPRAKSELLKFPYATHDDFVDWLSWVGLGLMSETAASAPAGNVVAFPKTGTLAWVKAASAARAKQERERKAAGGF